jgi:hypothetical protein
MNKILIIITSAILISGCGGAKNKVNIEADSNPTLIPKPIPENTAPTINTAPTVTGIPANSILAHTGYSFTPTAEDGENDPLTFSIINKPSWAVFDTLTGKLTGIPQQEFTYKNIVISVSDNKKSTPLPSFNIHVLNLLHDVSITWDVPVADVNGDDIEGLTGYKIMYGKESETYEHTLSIDDPSMTSTTLMNLERRDHYFSMKAMTLHGIESETAIEYKYIYVNELNL